jgi:hypothetical protein
VIRARDHRSGPAYDQYLLDRQAEIAAEQAAAAQTPEAQFKSAIDELHATEREAVLNSPISDENLSKFGVIDRSAFTEAQVESAMEAFKSTSDYVRSPANAKVLVNFIVRNKLSPGVFNSYMLAHKVLQLWAAYPDATTPEPTADPVPAPAVDPRTPSEIAAAKYRVRMSKIVVYDPIDNKPYTEFDLEQCDSKTELRLRRLMEGRIGSSTYDTYMEIQDIKAQQAAELARKLAE